jgi:hypothetical protein
LKVLNHGFGRHELAATEAAKQLVVSGVVAGKKAMVQTLAPGKVLGVLLDGIEDQTQRKTVEKSLAPVIVQKAIDLAHETGFWHK